jgi:hypothetical protein
MCNHAVGIFSNEYVYQNDSWDIKKIMVISFNYCPLCGAIL